MDYKQFMKLMEPGINSGINSIPALQEFINEFPYFQSAQVLLAKSMHDQQHVRYERQLKIAAVYAGDRKILYNLIHSKEEILNKEKSFVQETEIVSSLQEKIIENENIFLQPEENFIVPPIEDNVEVSSSVENIPVQTIFYNEPLEFIEEPEEVKEKVIADPHDIIRNRLKEILGLKNEEVEKSFPENTELKDEMIEPEEIHSIDNLEIKEIDKNEISHLHDRSESIQPEVIHDNEIELSQMETALESSLIQSLERLPVIQKSAASEKTELIESSKNEHSFLDWLKIKSTSEYGKVEEVHAEDDRLTQSEQPHKSIEIEESLSTEIIPEKSIEIDKLIDRFLDSDPKIVPSKKEFYSPANQAKKSVTENEDLVSETLAKIYFQQGNYQKARSSYERLSLLYPEKLAYFAALISEVEIAINNLDKQDL